MNDGRMLAPYPQIQPEVGWPGRLAQPDSAQILQALRRGDWDAAVRLGMDAGVTDINRLTDTLFYVLHPEMRGRRIDSSQRDLVREWTAIRDRRVRPVLQSPGRSPAGAPAPPGSVPAFLGVDIAGEENLRADWLRAKAQVPIDFAIIRATGGILLDKYFDRTWPKLKEAGIVRGAYMFLVFPRKSERLSNPVVQVETYIKTVRKLDKSDLPPTLDVEADTWQKTGMNPSQLLNYVYCAWKALRDYYGVAPLIYTSCRVWHEVLGDLPAPDLAESPLWLKDYYRPFAVRQARYDPQAFAGGRYSPRMPAHWGDATNWWIHQYQGDALGLPGFSSTVDMNRFNTTVRGAAGDRVRWVQFRLGIPQSGTFDVATERALRAFQSTNGIKADGMIDPRTFAYLCWSTPKPSPSSW